jgi:hypothetical protein
VFAAVFAGAEANESRFRRTIDALQMADGELQASFATQALLNLEEIYIAEADLARKEAEVHEAPAKLLGWSRAVDQYAAQLALVLEDIEFGLPIELRNNPREVSSVAVGGRTILLAHPRSDQQPAYEQSVLAVFCTAADCRQLTATLEGQQPIPVTTASVIPSWDFSPQGPVCRHRGVEVHFGVGGDISGHRSLCAQLMQELEMLAAELAWQQRHGVAIDWNTLSTRPTPGKPGHLVQLNSSGDALLLTVPLIDSTRGLLAQVSPWLQQRHLKSSAVTVSLDATQLGWN